MSVGKAAFSAQMCYGVVDSGLVFKSRYLLARVL